MKRFARKYGKKYGGNLYVEGSLSGHSLVSKGGEKGLEGIDIPEKIVALTGYVEFNDAKARRTGKEGSQIQTGYVTGLAIKDNFLFAITSDSVYRLDGPWYPEVITQQPFLKSLWESIKAVVIDRASKTS